jgi:UPF0176 protein
MEFKVISFYKYIEIRDPESLRLKLQRYCQEKHILGRILLGHEGINGAVCATNDSIESFKEFILNNSLFKDLTFRDQKTDSMTYHKLVVRVRDEICAFKTNVDLKNKAEYIEPQELEEWYNQNKDFIIIDVRNEHEYDLGHFKNATKIPTKTFKEFPEQIIKNISQATDKDKDIVLYCTGGIRCEKASAYLKEKGFAKVRHVKGGIINYVNQFPNGKWQGGLFVFDDRKVSNIQDPIADCIHCNIKTNSMINCFNLDCDKLIVSCNDCQLIFNHSCSNECLKAKRRRSTEFKVAPVAIESNQILATVKNYYPKAKVALIEVKKKLEIGNKVLISGTTTKKFEATILEMRNFEGAPINFAESNQLVTIPIDNLIRTNDILSI